MAINNLRRDFWALTCHNTCQRKKPNRRQAMPVIKYEIPKKIGVLSESALGCTKELNLISWNDKDPKYDLHDWAPGHEKMGKGIILSVEELLPFKEQLNESSKI